MSVEIGTEIAGYRIVRAIGEGGMAQVFLAERLSEGRQVALKVLKGELAGSGDFRRRFVRETRYATSLRHPNVVRVHDGGEADGCLYLAMDYIEGTDLYALLAAGPFEPPEAIAMLTQVGAALDAAHALGLLHRDVKPGNVLVASGTGAGEAARCYLADFGLSKHAEKDSVALTAAGNFVGTIHYTAPEQMLGKELDLRVDVYSLGCLLYECLTGEPPFAGRSEVEVMQAHIETPPPKPSEQLAGLPPELDAVLAKAMAKDPADRYESCGELMEAARVAAGVDRLPHAAAPSAGGEGEAMNETLKLKVTHGNAAGTEIVVEDEFLFGRQASGKGKLGDDVEISRQHAKIARGAQGGYTVEDLGSTNGTTVNGRKITSPELLYPGDAIELGGTRLVVQVSGSGASPGPDPLTPLDTVVEPAEPSPEPAAPPAAPPAAAEPAAPARLSLRLEVDFESGEVRLELDEESEPIRLVQEDGRWRLAP